jgi:hypothetical protein
MLAEAVQFLARTGFEVRNPIIFKSPYAAKSHRLRSG